jgi:IS30 family transposase
MTTNDRCTHLVLIRRLAGKEAAPLASTAIEALLPYKDKIHTITADNGKEFARHKEIAKGLDAEFYFARPYHSWERGANENTNGERVVTIRLRAGNYNVTCQLRLGMMGISEMRFHWWVSGL